MSFSTSKKTAVVGLIVVLFFVFVKPGFTRNIFRSVEKGLKFVTNATPVIGVLYRKTYLEPRDRKRTQRRFNKEAKKLSENLQKRASLTREAAIQRFYRDKSITPQEYMVRLQTFHRLEHHAGKKKMRYELMPSATEESRKMGRREAPRIGKTLKDLTKAGVAHVLTHSSRLKKVKENLNNGFGKVKGRLHKLEKKLNKPAAKLKEYNEKINRTFDKIKKKTVKPVANVTEKIGKTKEKITQKSEKAQKKLDKRYDQNVAKPFRKGIKKVAKGVDRAKKSVSKISERAERKSTDAFVKAVGSKPVQKAVEAIDLKNRLKNIEETSRKAGIRDKTLYKALDGAQKGLGKYVDATSTALYGTHQVTSEVNQLAKDTKKKLPGKIDRQALRGVVKVGEKTVVPIYEKKELAKQDLQSAEKAIQDGVDRVTGKVKGTALKTLGPVFTAVDDAESGAKELLDAGKDVASKITDPVKRVTVNPAVKALKKVKSRLDKAFNRLSNPKESHYIPMNEEEVKDAIEKSPDVKEAKRKLKLAVLRKRDPSIVKKAEALKQHRIREGMKPTEGGESFPEKLFSSALSKQNKANKAKSEIENLAARAKDPNLSQMDRQLAGLRLKQKLEKIKQAQQKAKQKAKDKGKNEKDEGKDVTLDDSKKPPKGPGEDPKVPEPGPKTPEGKTPPSPDDKRVAALKDAGTDTDKYDTTDDSGRTTDTTNVSVPDTGEDNGPSAPGLTQGERNLRDDATATQRSLKDKAQADSTDNQIAKNQTEHKDAQVSAQTKRDAAAQARDTVANTATYITGSALDQGAGIIGTGAGLHATGQTGHRDKDKDTDSEDDIDRCHSNNDCPKGYVCDTSTEKCIKKDDKPRTYSGSWSGSGTATASFGKGGSLSCPYGGTINLILHTNGKVTGTINGFALHSFNDDGSSGSCSKSGKSSGLSGTHANGSFSARKGGCGVKGSYTDKSASGKFT